MTNISVSNAIRSRVSNVFSMHLKNCSYDIQYYTTNKMDLLGIVQLLSRNRLCYTGIPVQRTVQQIRTVSSPTAIVCFINSPPGGVIMSSYCKHYATPRCGAAQSKTHSLKEILAKTHQSLAFAHAQCGRRTN